MRRRACRSPFHVGWAGASIPWGNEAEIFVIAILEGEEEIFSWPTCYIGPVPEPSQVEKKCLLDENSMYVNLINSLSPEKAKFHELKIISSPGEC